MLPTGSCLATTPCIALVAAEAGVSRLSLLPLLGVGWHGPWVLESLQVRDLGGSCMVRGYQEEPAQCEEPKGDHEVTGTPVQQEGKEREPAWWQGEPVRDTQQQGSPCGA